ncbi:MAG TPA: hypothetical protein VFN97_12030 [Actinospica sp.]|nr:hypothetical protein [Actinospica sp.]
MLTLTVSLLAVVGTTLIAAPAQAATPHDTLCPGSVTFNWDWNTSDLGFGFTEAHSVITITPCWDTASGGISQAYANISTTKTSTGNLFSTDQFVDGSYLVTQSAPQMMQIEATEKVTNPCGLPGLTTQCVHEQVVSIVQVWADGWVNVNSNPPPYIEQTNDPAFVAHNTSGPPDDYEQFVQPPV